MKTYFLILSSLLIISCSRSAGTGNIIYDQATIVKLSDKNVLKEQKLYGEAVRRKKVELAAYETNSPSRKPKKH
jgi:hypothetical protein